MYQEGNCKKSNILVTYILILVKNKKTEQHKWHLLLFHYVAALFS